MDTALPAMGFPAAGSAMAADQTGAYVRVLTSWSEFELIRPQWDEFHRRLRGGLFSSSGWLTAWRAQQEAAGGSDLEPRIVTIWRAGCLAAAAPLGIGRLAPSKYLPQFRPLAVRMLGDQAAGYTEWLAQSREDAESLVSEIARLGRRGWIHLDPVRTSSALHDPLQLLPDHVVVRAAEHFNCTTIDLRDGFQKYMDSRPREFRKLFRVSERRAAEGGAVYLTEKDCGETILDSVIKVSRRGWKGKAGTGIGVSAANVDYLRALWREFSPTDDIHVHVLLLGGKEAAHMVTIDCNDVAYALVSDFDEDYAHCSPGRLVILAGIRAAAARGAACCDLMRRTHYLERFSDEFYGTSRLAAFPRRNAAWFTFVADAAARHALGGLRQRKRKRARRVDFIGSADREGSA